MTNEKNKPEADEVPPSLIEFPCFFIIKVMGVADATFQPNIIDTIKVLVPTFSAEHIEARNSSSGKYISLSCNVWVTSQLALDEVYRAVTGHPQVKYVL